MVIEQDEERAEINSGNFKVIISDEGYVQIYYANRNGDFDCIESYTDEKGKCQKYDVDTGEIKRNKSI